MSTQIANPAALVQRLLENHIYVVNQQAQDGVMFFLFYALSPQSDERLMAQVNIQPRVGVQVKVKA